MDEPARYGTGFFQCFEEKLPVLIILEDCFSPIPSAHHMVNRPFAFDSQLPRHAGNSNFQSFHHNQGVFKSVPARPVKLSKKRSRHFPLPVTASTRTFQGRESSRKLA
jgi:hypothetical protein